jgi:hypothetical protein
MSSPLTSVASARAALIGCAWLIAVAALLKGERAETITTHVFGCPLFAAQ